MPSRNFVHPDFKSLSILEIASIAEACTLILQLFVGVPLKHLFGFPLVVRVLGPVHGLAVLAFAWMAIQAVSEAPASWSMRDRVRLFLGAVIPFGGFWNARFIARKAAPAALGAHS